MTTAVSGLERKNHDLIQAQIKEAWEDRGKRLQSTDRDLERACHESAGYLVRRAVGTVVLLVGRILGDRRVPAGCCHRCLQSADEGEHGWGVCPFED